MKYDIAAYIWPSYTGKEPRSYQFWEQGIGEWQTVKSAKTHFDGHPWPRTPLWGFLDEAEPKTMELQIEQALKYGVNVFIYDWYWYDSRPFLENCLNDGFLKAKNNKKMQFYLMWANHDANTLWDKRLSSTCNSVVWQGKIHPDDWDTICNRIIDKYFVLDNYYKIDGKPVFCIYESDNFINGFKSVKDAKLALDYLKDLAVKKGLKGVHIQLIARGASTKNYSGVDGASSYTISEIAKELKVDSLTHYQYAHFVDFMKKYSDIEKDVKAEFENLRNSVNVPYYPHATIGWDNSPRFNNPVPYYMIEQTPENFEKSLRIAKDYADKYLKGQKLITVNSWNEWTEDSYLIPDDVNGYAYLEKIKKVFIDEK